MRTLFIMFIMVMVYQYGSAPNHKDHKVKAPDIVFKGIDVRTNNHEI